LTKSQVVLDEIPVSASRGRPWRWPDNGGAKAVNKEKLFERQEIEKLLRVLVIEKFSSMAPGSGASFFSFRLLGLRLSKSHRHSQAFLLLLMRQKLAPGRADSI
jgi:hypothetical protein